MTAPGTYYFRADHELVGRVIAEKLRRRMSPLPDERVRVVRARTEGSV